MLVTRDTLRSEMVGLAPGETKERDMTWLDWTLGAAIAADGRTILFSETGEGGGAGYSVYIRKTDGSPAVRRGGEDLSAASGHCDSARPRSRLVISDPRGRMKTFKTDGLSAAWVPDERHSHRGGRTAAAAGRLDVAGGKPGCPVATAGGSHRSRRDWTVSVARIDGVTLYPLAGGEPPHSA
jgi:hypothetical protein